LSTLLFIMLKGIVRTKEVACMATTVQETYHGETGERYMKGGSLAEGIAGDAGVELSIKAKPSFYSTPA